MKNTHVGGGGGRGCVLKRWKFLELVAPTEGVGYQMNVELHFYEAIVDGLYSITFW